MPLFTAESKNLMRMSRTHGMENQTRVTLVGSLPVTGRKDSFLCFAGLGFDR